MNISKLKIIQKLCNTKKRSLVVKLWTNKNIARDWGKLGSNVLSLLQAYQAKKHGAMTKDVTGGELGNMTVICQSEDSSTQLDVKLENVTVWLTQAHMVQPVRLMAWTVKLRNFYLQVIQLT